MRRCTRCILPETFPGIRFDEEGLCQYCRRMPDAERRAAQKARLRTRFEALVPQVRARPGYHCLVSWSEGKDSTYTLLLLKQQYDLRILAFTFDNGFVSPAALKNMQVVAENLKVDHVIVKPRPNSTNCLLNSFANQVHLGQMGYHPYVMELAGLVREGYMGREEALDRLRVAAAPAVVAAVESKLGQMGSRG